jgi:hypothetical protein
MGEGLDRQRVADAVFPRPAPCGVNRHAHQPDGRRLAHQLAREHPPLVDRRRLGRDPIGRKRRHLLLESLLSVRQLENHGVRP